MGGIIYQLDHNRNDDEYRMVDKIKPTASPPGSDTRSLAEPGHSSHIISPQSSLYLLVVSE
jgi:hypothetical protein